MGFARLFRPTYADANNGAPVECAVARNFHCSLIFPHRRVKTLFMNKRTRND